MTGGGFISARKIIAIHRPLGDDLQPLIFRIPRVFFFFAFFFLSSALPPAWRGEGSGWMMTDGLGKASTQSNLAQD